MGGGMHSKVQRSATDALCVMEMGQRRGVGKGRRGERKRLCYVCVRCLLLANQRAVRGRVLRIVVVSYAQSKQRRSQRGERGMTAPPYVRLCPPGITHVQTEHGTTLLHTHISLNSVGSATICCMVDSALRFYTARLLKNLN